MHLRMLPVFSLTMSFAVSASELQPTKSGMYDIGGFSLYLECYENDKPKLILEQEFGRVGSDGVWLDHIKSLRDQYSVCLYDRSGLGKSEKGPVPFTINDNANRLHALLSAAEPLLIILPAVLTLRILSLRTIHFIRTKCWALFL